MYVKDRMISDLITISPNESISNVVDLMAKHKLHRIPVVNKNNDLVGLITEGVINNNTPNNSSSLSVYELNYLLNKLTVADIMIKNPIVINSDALLEEAATILRKNDIGCLPVVDANNKLIGIITHYDIFSAFIDMLGYNQKGTRYVLNITEDKVGVIADIASSFKEKNILISNIATCVTERGIEIVIIAVGDNSADCKTELISKGYNVTSMLKLN